MVLFITQSQIFLKLSSYSVGNWLGKTPNFNLTQTEVQKIIDGFKDKGKELLAEGIW